MHRILALVLLLGISVPFASAASRVECSVVQSKLLARKVPYCVVLPPSYDAEKTKRFPVIYYLHGLGDNEQSLVNAGGWNVYEQLLRKKKIGEFVMIGPAGFQSFYLDSQDGSLPYEQFFFTEFMPAVERKYRIGNTRDQRALLGISMGGFGAMHYAFARPQMFRAVSTHMAALRPNLPSSFAMQGEQRLMEAVFGHPTDAQYYKKVSPFTLAQKQPKSSLKGLAIRFDVGSNDDYGFDEGAAAFHKLLESRGVPHEYHVYPGTHNWSYVVQHFGESLEFLSKSLGLTK